MTVNREHKSIRIATLDPYAEPAVAGFSPQVQRAVLDAVRAFRAQGEKGEAQASDDRPSPEHQ